VELFELPAAEYKAAVYLLQRADERLQVNAGKSDLAEALQVSPASAARVLAALIDKGLIERVRRGRYMVKQPTTETGESLTSETSSLTHETSGLTEVAKFAIPVVTNTTNMISRTTSDEDLLTSNEVNKSLRAKRIPKGKDSVPTYSDNDDDLPVFGEPRDERLKPRPTKRGKERKQRRAWSDFGGKSRSEWTTFDAANYFSAAVETRKPTMWGVVNTGQLIAALNKWNKRWSGNVAEVVAAMDRYLNDPKAMSRLDRDPKPIEHFLQYLKQQPRAVKVDDEWLKQMYQETESVWGA
jgi:Mn-dependent DtxR family transcriptional regulator